MSEYAGKDAFSLAGEASKAYKAAMDAAKGLPTLGQKTTSRDMAKSAYETAMQDMPSRKGEESYMESIKVLQLIRDNLEFAA
eukprot:5458891-Prymnesium_polylepis.1